MKFADQRRIQSGTGIGGEERYDLDTPALPYGLRHVDGDTFRSLLSGVVGLVYPSCSEGGGGCVVGCMHAGIIPIVTRESSVDVTQATGIVLSDASVEAIRAAVRQLAATPPERLRAMATAAWDFARANHTRETFAAAYRTFAESIMAR